jgi:hypothetical protein
MATNEKLRGMKLPNPRYELGPLPESLLRIHGFTQLQTFFPTLSKLFRLNKFQTNEVWLKNPYKILEVDCSGTQGLCQIHCEGEAEKRTAFCKVTHLLDPIRWIQGHYSLPKDSGLPWHSKTWTSAWNKLQDPWNQAYIQTLAMYALSQIQEQNLSPHFNKFYGAFCARAGTYCFNLNDDYSSFRNKRWFWKSLQRSLFSLRIVNSGEGSGEVPQEILDEFLNPPSEDEFDDEDKKSNGDEEEILATGDENIDAGTLESASFASEDFASSDDDEGDSEEDSEEEEDEEDDDETDESEMENYTIFAEIPNFPVMLMFTEANQETMDSLLDQTELPAVRGTPEWERLWSAWIFQVIAACQVMQKVFGMTHNDLHTNNIVWSETKDEFFTYKAADGRIWKVPTYGKVFRLIDFGRAIFSFNGQMFISDDFRKGNDADGQYCFPPLNNSKSAQQIYPNPSFDLARLSVSLFEAIFPVKPAEADGKKILSEEEDLIVRETVSPLYNMLWTWMIDDDDRNILMEPDGTERFPDFDLYKHIAAHCHRADPAEQLGSAAFAQFRAESVEEGVHAYPLF